MSENIEKKVLDRVRKFLHAYAIGGATTFVDPRTGDLVSATYEARALADACLEGPGALDQQEFDGEDQANANT